MRYQEVVRRFLSVRGASSREWALSQTLVLCVEIDMAAPKYARGLATSASQGHHKGPQFLRVTMFRVHPEREPILLASAGSGIGTSPEPLTPLEEANFQIVHLWVQDWIAGRLDSLPQSTSTHLSERLLHPGGV